MLTKQLKATLPHLMVKAPSPCGNTSSSCPSKAIAPIRIYLPWIPSQVMKRRSRVASFEASNFLLSALPEFVVPQFAPRGTAPWQYPSRDIPEGIVKISSLGLFAEECGEVLCFTD